MSRDSCERSVNDVVNSDTARPTFKGRSGVLPADRTGQLSASAHNSEPFSCLTVVGSVAVCRSSRWNCSLNRSELEVQFLEAPEQKGAVPFEPTSARRTVLGL